MNNVNIENEKIIKQSIKILILIFFVIFILFLLFYFFDKKIDHTKIDELPYICDLLGEKHILNHIEDEKYFVYKKKINIKIEKDLEYDGKRDKEYYTDASWALVDDKQVKEYSGTIYFLSKKTKIKKAKKVGIYDPRIDDRIFIYEYKNLNNEKEYCLKSFEEMHVNYNNIKYIGIITEENWKKYEKKILINPLYQGYLNNLRAIKIRKV